MQTAQAIGLRGCDVCGAASRRVLCEQRFVSFDDGVGLLDAYDVVVCDVCGFMYADGLPEPAVFDRYYREMSKHEPEAEKAARPSYQRHNADLVALSVAERLPLRDARILDVGVGSGETLLALRDLGYTDLTGLDPSPRTASAVQGRYGLRILNMPVSMLAACTERFDVILLSGVLEHLRDLRPTIGLLKTLLSKQGRMCIAVPDAARFAQSVQSPFQYLSVEHINFFTKRTLEALFGRVGMALQASWHSTALLGVFAEPIVHGIFARADAELGVPADVGGSAEMMRYITKSKMRRCELTIAIRPLAISGEEVIVWGAGSLTMQLLTDPTFAMLNIVAFVDANANYWGKTLRGIRIVQPLRVKDFEQPILIVSYCYEDEIYGEIRNTYGLANPVRRLFGAQQRVKAGRFGCGRA